MTESLPPEDMPTTPPSRSERSPVSERIGPYKLLHKIGEGGMGAVWMAEQLQPVRRRVALKLIKAGQGTEEVIARFEAERQALAMMDHQNIAKVLDGGVTDDGRPYFAMELVKGIGITKYCDQTKLSLHDRLKLFIPVCRAIQHAHQKGVIHRDIKPSNVLVTMYDGQPVPKVIDFGLAKALQASQQLTEKTMYTEFGKVVGTLNYMSPEQAEMNAMDVDTRTDIYSLGVMLYELLTGSTPLEERSTRNKALLEVLLAIRESEPPRPSSRLTESGDAVTGISQQRQTDPKRLLQILRGDLDWIVMKALEKDRTRRYETAAGLADDIERFLDDEPIEARPPTAAYRMQKTLRKHWRSIGAAAAMLLALLLGIAGTTNGMLRASAQRKRAEAALVEAQESTRRAVEETARADASKRKMEEALTEAQVAKTRAEAEQDKADAAKAAAEAASLAASEAAHRAVMVKDFLVSTFRSPSPEVRGDEVTVLDAMAQATAAARSELANDPATRVIILEAIAETYTSLNLFEQARGVSTEALKIRESGIGDERDQLKSRLMAARLIDNHKQRYQELRKIESEAAKQFGQADDLTIEARTQLLSWELSFGFFPSSLIKLTKSLESSRESSAEPARFREGDLFVEVVHRNMELMKFSQSKDTAKVKEAMAKTIASYNELVSKALKNYSKFEDQGLVLALVLTNRGDFHRRNDAPQQAMIDFASAQQIIDSGIGRESHLAHLNWVKLQSMRALQDEILPAELPALQAKFFEIEANMNATMIPLIRMTFAGRSQALLRAFLGTSRTDLDFQRLVPILENWSKGFAGIQSISANSEPMLVATLLRAGQVDEARILLEDEPLNQVGKGDALTASSLVAEVLTKWHAETAQEVYQTLVDRYIKKLGETHLLTAKIRSFLAQSYRETGEWTKVAEQYEMAVQAIQASQPNQGDHVIAGLREALTAWQAAGNTKAACDTAQRILEVYRKRNANEPAKLATALRELGLAYGDDHRYPEAIEACEQSIEEAAKIKVPHVAGWAARFALARVLTKSGDHDRAIQTLRQVQRWRGATEDSVAGFPYSHGEVLLALAKAQWANHDYEESLATCDLAWSGDQRVSTNDGRDIRVLQGRVLLEMGRPKLAENVLTAAWQSLPADDLNGSHELAAALSSIGAAVGDHKRAVEWARKAEDDEVLAAALSAAGRDDEAVGLLRSQLAEYENRREARPADLVRLQVQLANALRNAGRHGESRAICEQVLRTQPDHAAAAYGRALTLRLEEKLPEALVAAQEVVQRYRDSNRRDAFAEACGWELLAEIELLTEALVDAKAHALSAKKQLSRVASALQRHHEFNTDRILGQIAIQAGNVEAGRASLERAFVGLRSFPFTIEKSLRYRTEQAASALRASYQIGSTSEAGKAEAHAESESSPAPN
jgi:serine/threonine protein kinase